MHTNELWTRSFTLLFSAKAEIRVRHNTAQFSLTPITCSVGTGGWWLPHWLAQVCVSRLRSQSLLAGGEQSHDGLNRLCRVSVGSDTVSLY